MDLGVDEAADLEQDVARTGLVNSPLQRAGAVGIEIGDIDDAAAAPAGGVRAEAFRTGERRERGGRARGRTDRNRDGSSCGATMCVADRHGEAVLQIRRCRAGGRGVVTRRDSGRVDERAGAGSDDHTALACRRWCAVGQSVTVSIGGTHTAAHHTRHRVRRSHHRCAHHRRAISRGERRDRDRHGAGGGVAAASEQTEGEQVDQPGHTVDRETAGGIADGHPKRVCATGRHGRIRCIAPTAVHADRRDATGGVGGDRVAQPGAVGVDSVELSGDHTARRLRGLGRA